MAGIADGVIVGSALVKAATGEGGVERVAELGSELARGAHTPRKG